MIATEELAREVAPEVTRPSSRTFSLPGGTAREDRDALIRAIADALLEIAAWDGSHEIGDYSYLILETEIASESLYAQFLSEPTKRGLVCELASGFYAKESGSEHRASPEQRGAMVSNGFTDGFDGNFRKVLVLDAPDAAQTIAEETIALLGNTFGWTAETRIRAKLTHVRRCASAPVLDDVSCADMIDLLARHGIEGRITEGRGGSSSAATVEAAMRGHAFTIRFGDRVDGTSRYRFVLVKAHVAKDADPGAASAFNAMTLIGRSWVSDGDAFVEAGVRVTGMTEDAIHRWLASWDDALATAKYWYRRVALCAGENVLEARHFSHHFHNLHRIARCHVRPAAEEAALVAMANDASPPELGDGIDAWAIFERYAATHPDQAMPIEARFVSRATADGIIAWLRRIDGVEWNVRTSGELDICHAVGDAQLVISPAHVRRAALCPDRFALEVTLEDATGARDILIGTDDFYFEPDEARVELGGVSFVITEMPATTSWFETTRRLRAIERQMAWAGPLPCAGPMAWLRGALAGAERIGLACAPERARFESVLAAARRAWKTTIAAERAQDAEVAL